MVFLPDTQHGWTQQRRSVLYGSLPRTHAGCNNANGLLPNVKYGLILVEYPSYYLLPLGFGLCHISRVSQS